MRKAIIKIVAGISLAGGIAACGTTRTVPGPTVTVTVPGPAATVTRVVQVKVPGPAVTVTQRVTVYPQPGQQIGTWSGHGSQVTKSFYAPTGGAFIVKWSYKDNDDCSLGSCQASNFIVDATDSNASLGASLPNDIASSGSGSTEVTSVNPGDVEAFNVQAQPGCHWTITVTAGAS